MILYAKLAAAAAVLLALIGFGWWLGSSHWKAQYEALQAQNWQGQAQAQKDRADALQNDLKNLQATAANNAKVIHDLNEQNATAIDDRARLGMQLARVLARATRSQACGGSVPQAASGQNAPRPGAAPGDGRPADLPRLIADALAECKGNGRQLNALSQEIAPQL
jgi:hypothetical protein